MPRETSTKSMKVIGVVQNLPPYSGRKPPEWSYLLMQEVDKLSDGQWLDILIPTLTSRRQVYGVFSSLRSCGYKISGRKLSDGVHAYIARRKPH
jgi:hypothetical protein